MITNIPKVATMLATNIPRIDRLVLEAPAQGSARRIHGSHKNARSLARWNAFCLRPCSSRRKRAQSIGVSVTETTPETSTAITIVTANSCSSRPTMPLMNTIGMNTAASDTVIDRIVKPISADPSIAAR